MAWYSDEQYAMIQDSREKKSTAASAFKQRTHCGKGGGVRLPSDFMTKKERDSMNGECVSYRMSDPIKWAEFKTWPEEHQKTYIIQVREKYKVPNTALAEAFGIEQTTVNRYIKCLGLAQGKESGAAGRCWHDSDDAVRFWAWWKGEEEKPIETPDLRKPMSWSTFKSLSKEQKVEYITWIREYFGAPDKHIAETLFRVSSPAIRRYFAEAGLCEGKSAGGKGKKNWNRESFIAWCDQIRKKPVEGPSTPVDISENTSIDDLFQKHVENIEVYETVNSVDDPIIIHCAGPIEMVEPTVEPLEAVEEDFNDGVKEMVMPEISEDEIVPEVPKSCWETCEMADECEKKRIYDAGPIAFMGNSIPVIPKSGSMTFSGNNVDDILTILKTLLGGVRVNLKVEWECEFE